MKKSFKIFLTFSLALNVFFICSLLVNKAIRASYQEEHEFTEEVNVGEERKKLISELKTKFPEMADKKLLFINIWSPGDWDSMKNMPRFDSLVQPLNKDMAYFFVSEAKSDYAWRMLKAKTRKAKNFGYLNDQKGFVTSVFQEMNILNRAPYKWYHPNVTMIITADGNVKFLKMLPIIHGTIKPSGGKTLQQTVDSIENTNDKNYFKSIDSALSVVKW
jgi:hypothetical protein